VYAYTGARLAAGVISFDEVGGELPRKVLAIPYQRAQVLDRQLVGNIEILDPQFGNIWTNIDRSLFRQLNVQPGDTVRVIISNAGKQVFDGEMPYHRSFGRVELGQPLLYLNSLSKVSLALNQGNFSATHGVLSGADWRIVVVPVNAR
jgi:S-adenosylmethionine hydrolase